MSVGECGLFSRKPVTPLPSFLYYVTRLHALVYCSLITVTLRRSADFLPFFAGCVNSTLVFT